MQGPGYLHLHRTIWQFQENTSVPGSMDLRKEIEDG